MIPPPYLIPLKHPEKAEPPQTIDRAGSTGKTRRMRNRQMLHLKYKKTSGI